MTDDTDGTVWVECDEDSRNRLEYHWILRRVVRMERPEREREDTEERDREGTEM